MRDDFGDNGAGDDGTGSDDIGSDDTGSGGPGAPAAATSRRQRWMAVLARASADDLQARLPPLPAYTRLRGPEAGLVMLRGRAGGTGAPFNLGEATVARCTVRTASGAVGHAYCLGRDLRQAELAAVLDALLQDPGAGPALEAEVVAPLAAAQAARRALLARRAAATQVQFFTLATMRS